MISEYARQEVEKLRKRGRLFRSLNKVVTVSIFAVFICVFAYAFVNSQNKEIEALFPLIIISIFVVIILGNLLRWKASKCREEFKTRYKTEFVQCVLDENLDNVTYIPDQGFSRQEVKDFQLVSLSSIFRSEDYLKAAYKGVEFEQSDVTIIHRRQKKSDQIYFKGRMMKLTYPKKQVEAMQIFSRNFMHRACSVTGQVMIYGGVVSAEAETPGLTRTEDVEFNKKFDVYSVSEYDAFYLLTPPFMEALKKLADRYASVAFHFTGTDLYIAIGTGRDTFECAWSKPIEYENEENRIKTDVNEIKNIIDALQLGNE